MGKVGTIYPTQRVNIVAGNKYGRLTVVKEVERVSKSAGIRGHTLARVFTCSCECGATCTVQLSRLRSGITKSCGCIRKGANNSHFTHGMTKTRVFKIWQGILKRCYNKNATNYYLYGARGVGVCKRWKNSFVAFYEDMGEPRDNESIERIDNDGDYCKENCKWATVVEQANNKRNSKRLTYNGVTKTVAEWSRLLGWCRYTLYRRIEAGWKTEKILTTPPRIVVRPTRR